MNSTNTSDAEIETNPASPVDLASALACLAAPAMLVTIEAPGVQIFCAITPTTSTVSAKVATDGELDAQLTTGSASLKESVLSVLTRWNQHSRQKNGVANS